MNTEPAHLADDPASRPPAPRDARPSSGPSPRSSSRRGEVLVATLGLRPAVITSALDLLLADGRTIEEVVVVHTTPRGTDDDTDHPGLAPLHALFPRNAGYAHPQATYPCRLRTVALADEGGPIADVATREHARIAFQALYRTVLDFKQRGRIVHVCIAGGRKSLSIFAMAVAQLLFDADDRLWHIIASDEFGASRRMHPTARDDAALVNIPVLSIGLCHIGSVSALLLADDPIRAVDAQRAAIRRERGQDCQRFLTDVLTAQERRLVLLLLRQVVEHHTSPTYDELARELVISSKAVRNRFSEIYGKMAAHFGTDEGTADNRVLVGLLAPYYQHIAE